MCIRVRTSSRQGLPVKVLPNTYQITSYNFTLFDNFLVCEAQVTDEKVIDVTFVTGSSLPLTTLQHSLVSSDHE